MPRKLPQTARKQKTDESQEFDRCQTPDYALAPLIPYLPKSAILWESACGDGQIVAALSGQGFNVVATDILTGHNYFTCPPPDHDIQVTNMPYSAKYPWIFRAYQIGKPFAFLIPVNSLGAASLNSLIDKHGCEIMFLNRRVNFKMPRLGYSGRGAQFPVMWFCYHVLPSQIMVGKIYPPKKSTLPAGIVQESLL